MCTTNLDQIDYRDLAKLLTPGLKGRRLFLSACSMVHKAMASEIIPTTGCISVVGPREDISFTTAAVFWPAVYHLMFTHNDAAMGHLALTRSSTPGRVRLHRNVLQPETQTRQERDAVARRVREAAENLTRRRLRNSGLFTTFIEGNWPNI